MIHYGHCCAFDETGPILTNVQNDRSIMDLIRDGSYIYCDPAITDEQFFSTKITAREVPLRLIGFNLPVFADVVLDMMQDNALRPLTIHELLSLAAQFPQMGRSFSIVALGSALALGENIHCVPCVAPFQSGRLLDLPPLKTEWKSRDKCRFGCIRID